jgi:hypothetical protein
VDTAWFLDQLFGDSVSEEALICIWTLPDKRSQFFSTTQAATKYALDQVNKDVYFGLGLYRSGITSGRGTADDVVMITAMWADIDFGERKKKGTPPDEDAAKEIIKRTGLKGSIIVNSGHGLHPYWLFKEPLTIDLQSRSIIKRWGQTVQACAGSIKYSVDSVWDLARVLRVPGTVNYKGDAPLDVKVITPRSDAIRYDISDIESWCVTEDVNIDAEKFEVDAVGIDMNAEAPSDKLLAAIENSDSFRKTWKYDRPGMKDDSPSAYDMSLANQAAALGWTDQEITNLIIAFRRKHNLDMSKLRRRTYIELTLKNARATTGSLEAAQELEANELPTQYTDEESRAAKEEEVKRQLSKLFGVSISRWVKHGGDGEANFHLVLTSGKDIFIGPVGNVGNQKHFRLVIFEYSKKMFPIMPAGRWNRICEALASIEEDVDNPQAGRLNKMNMWVSGYLTLKSAMLEKDRESAIMESLPLIDSGQIHIPYAGFNKYVQNTYGPVKESYLWAALKAAGWEPVWLWAQRKIKKRYYKCPLDANQAEDVLGIVLAKKAPRQPGLRVDQPGQNEP